MKELLEKYAKVIINTCLKVKENQPLFISANYERIDFVRILANEAYKIGVKDIYFELTDSIIKRDLLLNLEVEDLKNNPYWDKKIWNEYAKKGAAFVMLASETPGLLKDVDSNKISELRIHSQKTRIEFDDLRDKKMVPWCIAAVPTESWAREVFPDSADPLNDLWNKILEICLIKEENPEKLWLEKINKLATRSEKLSELKIKKLKYKNSLGTDFEIELPKNNLWCSGSEELATGEECLVNFPTEEVFTSPTNDSANGIVYASLPLSYQDNLIKDFWIKFENGVAVDYDAKEGKEILKGIIEGCPNSNRLGEVALVESDSCISNQNMIFYETLFDENAACHLALGAAFPECIIDGEKMSKEEIAKCKLNDCLNHVDFMIGTKDLSIIGLTEDNQEIVIFQNGNFTNLLK